LLAEILRLVRSGSVARGKAHLNVTVDLFFRGLRRLARRRTAIREVIDDQHHSGAGPDTEQKTPETI
jgi:hypothetical protein